MADITPQDDRIAAGGAHLSDSVPAGSRGSTHSVATEPCSDPQVQEKSQILSQGSSSQQGSDLEKNMRSLSQSRTIEQQSSLWFDLQKEEHSCCKSGTRQLQDNFFESLFGAIIVFAVFGGSITFACIIEIPKNGQSHGRIPYKKARTFMSISWLLFTLDLCFSSIYTAATYLRRRSLSIEAWEVSRFQYANLVATLILYELSVGALVFVGVAVSAYSEYVGYTATVFFLFLFVAIFVGWVIMYRKLSRKIRVREETKSKPDQSASTKQTKQQ